jgi:hypothetical protein
MLIKFYLLTQIKLLLCGLIGLGSLATVDNRDLGALSRLRISLTTIVKIKRLAGDSLELLLLIGSVLVLVRRNLVLLGVRVEINLHLEVSITLHITKIHLGTIVVQCLLDSLDDFTAEDILDRLDVKLLLQGAPALTKRAGAQNQVDDQLLIDDKLVGDRMNRTLNEKLVTLLFVVIQIGNKILH